MEDLMDQHTDTGDESAERIRALYTQRNGLPPLVPLGTLPTKPGRDTPAEEAKARQRMYDLLRPDRRASSAEVEVLTAARIPLLERPNGGFRINPEVERQSAETALEAAVDRAVGIARLYGLAPGSSVLVTPGTLPTQSRKGASDEENHARQRMHHLLKPNCLASPAEIEVLTKANIPLLERQDGGFYINPEVERESDETAAKAAVDRAVGIAKLYGLAPGSSALVTPGTLPAIDRQGAPDEENQARQRMHHLVRPNRRATPAEVEVLTKAKIPLLERQDGGFYINPEVEREISETAAKAAVDRAVGIAKLYGLAPGSSALVTPGTLPTKRKKGAPDEENHARQRMHDLLKPNCLASPAEVEVLTKAKIPLRARQDGGFHINPEVERESDGTAAKAGVDNAMGIARLYGLAPGSSVLVTPGTLPKKSRKGAPDEENHARKRMHNLLQLGRRASPAEVEVLTKAKIPLLERQNGGFHINPTVPRERDRRNAESSAVSTLPPPQQPSIAAPDSPPPMTAAYAWPTQPASHVHEQAFNQQHQNSSVLAGVGTPAGYYLPPLPHQTAPPQPAIPHTKPAARTPSPTESHLAKRQKR
ncbi:hypothetical protein ACJ6WF_21000 [Streptomyces sp. MMS24-I2-30]|uniref:hypothetical protein n=1 Tax=Streptomyces sp. MMS24-I2-30 TaxID=3351564 RepID=UPI003896974C